jgi:hypothetical protein
VDGSVLFVIDQVDYPDSHAKGGVYTRSVDLSSIPTLEFPTGNVLAFLVCSPHISIQTFHVWATGNGNLTLGEPRPRQGNIDFHQANYLLSFVLQGLPTDSGLTSSPKQVGTGLIARLMFGTDDLSRYMPPAPLANITAVYKQLIHSAMEKLLSGAIATEIVPGGHMEDQMQMVLTSSLGHVITSAILFTFLAIALVAAHFRKGRVAFTLVNVAAALADSDVPQKSAEMEQFKAGMGERKVLKLVPGDDGRLYCVYESVD